MATLMKALPVYHLDMKKTGDKEAEVLHAAKACRLTNGATELLLFYAKRSSGFTPSAKFITEKTGYSRSQIFKARNELESKTLILVKEDGIYVNWNAIYTLQAAEPRYTSKKGEWNLPQEKESVANRLVEAFKNEEDMNHLFSLMKFVSDAEYDKWKRIMTGELSEKDCKNQYYDKADIYCSPQERLADEEKKKKKFEIPEIEYDDEEYNEFMAQEIGPLPF